MKLRMLGALLLALSGTIGIQARGGSAVAAAHTTSLPSFKATGGAGVTIQNSTTQEDKFNTLKGYITLVLENSGNAGAGADGIKNDVPKPATIPSQMNIFLRTSEPGKALIEYFVRELAKRLESAEWMFRGKDITTVTTTGKKIQSALEAIQSSMGPDNIDFSRTIIGTDRRTTIGSDLSAALAHIAPYTGSNDDITSRFAAWLRSSATSWSSTSGTANIAVVAKSLRNSAGSSNGQISQAAFVAHAADIVAGLLAIPFSVLQSMYNGTLAGWTPKNSDDLYMLIRRISMQAPDVFTANKKRLLEIYRAANGPNTTSNPAVYDIDAAVQSELDAADAALANTAPAPSTGRGGRS